MANMKSEDKREEYYAQKIQDYGKKHKGFQRESVTAILNLTYTYDVVSGYLSRTLLEKGLSRSAFNVLNIILRSEVKGCTHKELSELLLVSKANVSEVVDSLARKKLVERTYSTVDRRVSMVTITDAGKKLIEETVPLYYQKITELVSNLTNDQKVQLSQLLIKLRLNITEKEK
jgi:MarR family 2-MHQ and catechol resistance regulon transcriptional repressor